MDVFLKKLAATMKARGVGDGAEVKMKEIRHDEDKNVYQCDIKYKNLYFSIHPVDDENRLLNIYWQRDKTTLEPLTHVSQELAIEFVRSQVEQMDRPTYANKAYSKGLEPVLRKSADVDELDDNQLDRALEELLAELEETERKSGMKTPDTDEMTEPSIYKKNMVQSFGKDNPKIEGTKTPTKTNVSQQSFEKDSLVNWNKETKEAEASNLNPATLTEHNVSRVDKNEDDFGPTRLNEGLRNKRLIYTVETGAIFVDNALYEQYKNEKGTKWGYGKNGEVVLLKENQKSSGHFVPVNLRGKK
jgi:hypothetical protein